MLASRFMLTGKVRNLVECLLGSVLVVQMDFIGLEDSIEFLSGARNGVVTAIAQDHLLLQLVLLLYELA